MKTLLSFSVLCFTSFYVQATSVLASSFGWNGSDDTQALEDAFHSGYDTLIIDLQSGNWVSGPLIFHLGDDSDIHNLTVIFEPSVTLEAKTGAYDDHPYDGLLNFFGCSNINLLGYNATLKMNKQEYIDLNDGSQWRHAVSISGCVNMNVYGFEILDTGGDGVEVAGLWQQAVPSENVRILDCKIDNAFRNGVSITSCDGCQIEHCEITNTNGQNPQFGIDLEPNHWYELNKDILIKNCRIKGNVRGGIKLEYWKMTPSSEPFSVTIQDCYIADGYYGFDIDIWTDSLAYGHIDIERCVVENIAFEGVNSHKRNTSSFTVKDCVFRNVATEDFDEHGQDVYPFRIVGIGAFPGVENWVGNFTFEDVFLDQTEANEDFFVLVHWGQALGAKDVTVDATVLNPNGSSYYIEGSQVNVSVDVQDLLTLPSNSINISSSNTVAYEVGADTTASFSVTRTSSNTSYPLGVFYENSGTASNCLDYHYIPQAIVIPTDNSQTTYPISAIKDDLTEGVEPFEIDLQTDAWYSISSGNIELNIDDAEAVLAVEYLAQLRARPSENGVLLNWVTASELNNDFFLIERSQNLIEWKNIGHVKAAENGKLTNVYKAFDTLPPTGNLYYRLKQTDFDGSFSYSNIAPVYFEKTNFSVFPNPTSGLIELEFPKFFQSQILIKDCMGKTVIQESFSGTNLNLDLSKLPAGIYSISFLGEVRNNPKKLIVKR